jgi:hypothetical protein
MRSAPNLRAERYRVDGPPRSRVGAFVVPVRDGGVLRVLVGEGGGWDHISVSRASRCPTWEEMCLVRDLFFRDDEWVMQLHPPRDANINIHPYTLHLWRPQTAEERAAVLADWQLAGEDDPLAHLPTPGPIPIPPREMV